MSQSELAAQAGTTSTTKSQRMYLAWGSGVLLAIAATASVIAALRPPAASAIVIAPLAQGIGDVVVSGRYPWLDEIADATNCPNETVAVLLDAIDQAAQLPPNDPNAPTARQRLLIRYFILACMDEPRNRKSAGSDLCAAAGQARDPTPDWDVVIKHLEAADS